MELNQYHKRVIIGMKKVATVAHFLVGSFMYKYVRRQPERLTHK